MSKVQKQFIAKLKDGLAEAVYELGQKALFEAKTKVPVNTGNLKGSGTISKTNTGCVISFGGPAAPYADAVENGREAEPFNSSPFTQTVAAHVRKTPNGTIRVKGYTRNLIGIRPVRSSKTGAWFMATGTPAQEGTYFLRDALTKTLREGLKGMNKLLPKVIKVNP